MKITIELTIGEKNEALITKHNRSNFKNEQITFNRATEYSFVLTLFRVLADVFKFVDFDDIKV